MKPSIKTLCYSLLAITLLVSCSNKQSLQTYFVDNQESPNFTTVDIPTSIVDFENADLTADEKEAYKSVDKLNFLGFKLDSTNQETYQVEKAKVASILEDEKYIELGDFNMFGSKLELKYIGDDNLADEFIIFGSSKEYGFGVLRVLGDDMSPAKLVRLAESMNKGKVDETQLKGIINFFK
ncbi:DUF4252 domain-containing protein [Lacinutrix sp. C3R15]|uniref:DUF4252 domain-containing protein n=1 Tax=Flavobacteriaceae TaxID=49546 RepID=UPI001C08E1B3|nr:MULTISPECIES: DUF4252 domain-containing protein [Flavobacteriaceae]MBU2938863.1 DUF4252 domain-containing protein [Lacinutrix sp. C3R15]MDO6622176.1 DUF4252 domain-containing protein [Oceanihabitans sp. 1_MG-2023]